MNSSKAHVERSKIFLELAKLKIEFDEHCNNGGFSDAESIKRSIKSGTEYFLSIGGSNFEKVKFKSELKRLPVEEIRHLDERGLRIWRSYAEAMERLCRVNQPLKYYVLSLKKMADMRMLVFSGAILSKMLKFLKNPQELPDKEEVLIPYDVQAA